MRSWHRGNKWCREGAGREREERVRVRVRRTSLWKAGSSEGFFSACAASLSAIHVSALVISSSRPVVSYTRQRKRGGEACVDVHTGREGGKNESARAKKKKRGRG